MMLHQNVVIVSELVTNTFKSISNWVCLYLNENNILIHHLKTFFNKYLHTNTNALKVYLKYFKIGTWFFLHFFDNISFYLFLGLDISI